MAAMNNDRAFIGVNLGALVALVLGIIGCVIGGVINAADFYRAWLCAYLFWLGLPLAAVALVLVHDLTGGRWMASARPALDAAILTMPLATLAGLAGFVGLGALFSWVRPPAGLGNVFYLNSAMFWLRYGVFVVLWNLLAAFALWAPRGEAAPIAPSLSWLSGLGLVVLAFSTGFAAIDWILSLEPKFWSSVFPYIVAAGWFNTGLAVVLLVVAAGGDFAGSRRDHMADLAAILFGTTIFWAYVEFSQFLIIWESNLGTEIPYYLTRLDGVWRAALYVWIAFGFVVPFFVLLWRPAKRSRAVVATISVLIALGQVAEKWWFVIPEFSDAGPFWLDVAAIAALGGAMILLFVWGARLGHPAGPGIWPMWKAASDG
jgi:hypothetical protein